MISISPRRDGVEGLTAYLQGAHEIKYITPACHAPNHARFYERNLVTVPSGRTVISPSLVWLGKASLRGT